MKIVAVRLNGLRDLSMRPARLYTDNSTTNSSMRLYSGQKF